METARRAMAVGRWWPAHAVLALITLAYTLVWAGGGGPEQASGWAMLPVHLAALAGLDALALWLMTGGHIFIWRDGELYRSLVHEAAGPTTTAAEADDSVVELRALARRREITALAVHAGTIAGFATALAAEASGLTQIVVIALASSVTGFVSYRLADTVDPDVEASFVAHTRNRTTAKPSW